MTDKNKTTGARSKEDIRSRIYKDVFKKAVINQLILGHVLCSKCGKMTKIYYLDQAKKIICQDCLDKIIEKEINNLLFHQEKIIIKSLSGKRLSKDEKAKFFYLTGMRIKR